MLRDNEIGNLNWAVADVPTSHNGAYRRIGCVGDGNCMFHAILKALSPVYQESYSMNTYVREVDVGLQERVLEQHIYTPSVFQRVFSTVRTPGMDVYYTITNMEEYGYIMKTFRREYARKFRLDLAKKIKAGEMDHLITKWFQGSLELAQFDIDAEKSWDKAIDRVRADLVSSLEGTSDVQTDFLLLLTSYLGIDIYLLRDKQLAEGSSPLYGGESLHAAIAGPSNRRPQNDRNLREKDRRSIVLLSVNDNHYELVIKAPRQDAPPSIISVYSTTESLISYLYNTLLSSRLQA